MSYSQTPGTPYIQTPKDGKFAVTAAYGCKEIKQDYPSSSDGIYWIDPDGAGTAFTAIQVYCDMTTDGGGWTLLQSFGNNKTNTTSISVTAMPSTSFYSVSNNIINDLLNNSNKTIMVSAHLSATWTKTAAVKQTVQYFTDGTVRYGYEKITDGTVLITDGTSATTARNPLWVLTSPPRKSSFITLDSRDCTYEPLTQCTAGDKTDYGQADYENATFIRFYYYTGCTGGQYYSGATYLNGSTTTYTDNPVNGFIAFWIR